MTREWDYFAREWFNIEWMEIFLSWMEIIPIREKKCSIPNGNRDLVLIWRDFLHKHSRFDWNRLELVNNHRIVQNWTYIPYWYLRKPIFLGLILSIWNRLDRFQIEWMELLPFTSEIFPFPCLPNRVGSWKSVKEAGNGTSSLFASCSEKDARLKNQTQPDVAWRQWLSGETEPAKVQGALCSVVLLYSKVSQNPSQPRWSSDNN